MENGFIELVISMVGSLGFPIVCCCFMWKYINETMKEFTNNLIENTRMLTRMCDKLDMWPDLKGGDADDCE